MKKYVICGVSNRALEMFIKPLLNEFSKENEIAGLLDSDPMRFTICKEKYPKLEPVPTFHPEQFETMVDQTKPDYVIVTGRDNTHIDYILRALHKQVNVITEKPMVTNAADAFKVMQAEAESKGEVIVTFNYANPLLGRFSDFLVSQGGTTVLTEVPEMFGAETILMERAADGEVFEKTVELINEFKEYFIQNKQPVYENPSPGNKAGGITTLEDKSLGCTQKAGTSVVTDVLKYGEMIKEKGLNLLSAPGNDLVASSALAAAGCQLVLFTTGRGTPFGAVVPTMKILTNTPIYEAKPHWIDFNAGVLLEKETDVVLREFITYILQVASGELVNNEKNDFREIAIFKTGVTL